MKGVPCFMEASSLSIDEPGSTSSAVQIPSAEEYLLYTYVHGFADFSSRLGHRLQWE
jgi:hypothetical protein